MSGTWSTSTGGVVGGEWPNPPSASPHRLQPTPHTQNHPHQLHQPIEQQFGAMHLGSAPLSAAHEPSPVKNFGAFGGGLFFSHQPSGQPHNNTSSASASASAGTYRMHEEQQQARHMGAFNQYPTPHQQHEQIATGTGGKSILKEVMGMMQPPHQPHQPQPHPHSHPHPQGFPSSAYPSPVSSLPVGASSIGSGLRPPLRSAGGPPGFKPPPGFHHDNNHTHIHQPQHQPQSMPPPGMSNSNPPPSFNAPLLPAPLQNDSHVQCSLCRVIVVNNPHSLFQHDHSPQHIENERRARAQQEQQQGGVPPNGAPPGFDLAHLQAQLRAYMIASEQAKAQGLQPAPMDPNLMNQLKAVQDAMQRGIAPPLSGPPVAPPPAPVEEANPADGKPASAAAGSAGPAKPPGVPSSVGPFPTRAALIHASALAPVIPSKRLNFKRGTPFLVPVNLEFDLEALLRTLQVDPNTFQIREEIRASCEKLIQQIFGAGSEDKVCVKLFGSSVNGLCETTSDVDLCLQIRDLERVMEETKLSKSIIVEKIGELFKPHFTEILPLPKARVPIIKFVAPKYELACDLGINNLLACKNSELIRDYMSLDTRARDMCLLVKHWARARKINDPYRGTLSSYCYVMMVIHYLQNPLHVHPPILPCLQTFGRSDATQEEIDKERVDGLDCWYERDMEKVKKAAPQNNQTLGELLVSMRSETHGRMRTFLSVSFTLSLASL